MFNRELWYVYIYNVYVYLVRATYFFARVSNFTRYLRAKMNYTAANALV